MTNKEAIEILRRHASWPLWSLEAHKALDMAIAALEKQAQEKPLTVLPCGDDVTLECNSLLYKGDHWNPPTLTAFASDPSTRSGLRVHCFGIEDAEKALEGMKNEL